MLPVAEVAATTATVARVSAPKTMKESEGLIKAKKEERLKLENSASAKTKQIQVQVCVCKCKCKCRCKTTNNCHENIPRSSSFHFLGLSPTKKAYAAVVAWIFTEEREDDAN